MIAAFIALLKANPRPFILGGVVLAVFLLLGGVYMKGRGDGASGEKRAEAARLEQARKDVAKREVKASAITTQVAADVTKTRVEIQFRTRTLIEKVPTYVTAEADRDCTVPAGFVRLHDAAASGSPSSLPGAAGGSIDAPSGVPLSAALATVVGNYGVAYDWRAEALGWRSWYTEQKAAWEK